jgi:hypothetical protein
MRIPVYKSQGRPTSEAPGARITARMNAQPFVQAELQKGAIATEVANQVGEYANMRYKMITETQKNEAIFSAKEGLMALSSQLEKDRDVGNIFDGELKYAQGVKSVYDQMRATVGKNKYALQDFDNSFRQMEIPIKFRLQEVIDLKIEKRRQAALKAREDQQVSIYSNPFLDITSDELALEQSQLQSMVEQAVRNGGVNPEIMGNVSQRVLSKAFKNLIPAYAGTDLNKAIGLSSVLSQIQQVRNGKLEAEAMVGMSTLPPHVLNMLMAVPAEEANAVVQDTIQMASTFFSAKEKIDDEYEEEIGKNNTQAYNLLVSLDSTDTVSKSTLQQVLNPAIFERLVDSYEERGIPFQSLSGLEAQVVLHESLTSQMWATPAQQEAMEEAMSVSEAPTAFRPAGKGDAVVYSELYGTAENGMLTVADLNAKRSSLDVGQYNGLRTKIANEADEGLAVGSRLLSRHFRYNAQMAIGRDDRLAQASKAAFENADFALRDEFSRRESEGNPMTLAEIRQFAMEKRDEFDVIYREELRAEYLNYVSSGQSQIIGLTIDIADPLNSIDAFYDGLEATQQEQLRDKIFVLKSQIKARYANQGLFD